MAGSQKKIFLPLNRQHCRAGGRWAHELATDYWLMMQGGLDIFAAASTATGDELAENGWTSTSLVNTAGSGADFMSSSDKGTPSHALTNASADLLKSPSLFADYVHARSAATLAGQSNMPRYLIARWWGAMTVASADEPRSGWGFIEDGGAASVEADQLAWISSDGTNFQIGGNAGTPVNIATVDTSWHEFAIVIAVSTAKAYAFIDPTWIGTPPIGAALGSIDIQQDEAPYAFGFHALTTNRPALGLTHIYYEW